MKKIIICNLFLLIIAALIMQCSQKGSIKNEEYVYIIDVYSGDVKVSHDEGKEWKNVEAGMTLVENDMLKTGSDSFCDIIMPNRGIFRMAGNSVISIKYLRKEIESINIMKGKIALNITKPLQEKNKYLVETSAVVVAVRGTEFTVKTDGIKTSAAVNKGLISVKRNLELKVPETIDQAELEKDLEVQVKQDESVEFDLNENKTLEDSINQELGGVTDNEKAKKILSKIKGKSLKNVKKADIKEMREEFKDLTDSEKLKKAEEEWKKYQKEIEKDKEYLNKNVKEIQQKTGHKGISEKKVSEDKTTAEEDAANKIADKKVDEMKEKLKQKKSLKDGVNKEKDVRGNKKSTLEELKNKVKSRNK